MKKQHLFIGGKLTESVDYKELQAPYSGETLAEVSSASAEEAEAAVVAAVQAGKAMRQMPAHQRADILYKLSSMLEERKEEAARIIALEAAKPITAALAEVDRTVETYRFAAEEAKRLTGETVPMDAAKGGEGRIGYTMRQPLGVIGAITPFNFPMNLVAHKVGPALAAGNTIVLKPAEQTPLSSYYIANLLQEAGLPDGALNVVSGDGKTIGDVLVEHPRVAHITFTGSPAVGTNIRSKAGLKRVTLELGSNAAVIVDKDADLDKVVPRCVTGAFTYQGQVCISLQRIYVHRDISEEFIRRFAEAAKQVVVGDPLSPDTVVSALITSKDVQRTLDWIEEAKQAGAEVAAGGQAEGGVLRPTVLINVPRDAKVSCQEVFAPIVVINTVDSVEEGIEHVNDSIYGLQAGVFTNDIHTALRAVDQIEAGGVMINDIPTFRVDHMPYGGVKQSGIGREGVKYAVEEMTELKFVMFNKG
ncbi:aldehyde dehydrogenase family protein [Paenibacillus amylolyticus]|uniref:aldehyde dehydrogenase family protein n=1 Tax=Paenibacillus TaxID=44249 RepID=UPI00105AA66B|nr:MULTISPECIES: aldehyde dehydrogenase family protein [Paenibacillus]TDL60165.1 aldehyde dehydrogenase family protein [Paenibacillus amylolyticus]WJM08957.1 aldehyde dehydrogenase family protein [Paenibacillus sp. PK1-4R]